MFQLLDKLSNEMFMYIKTLNFSEAQAKIIYKTYLKFIKEKYKTQLLIYKRAVELSEKKPVKEVCLFALRTGKEVVY